MFCRCDHACTVIGEKFYIMGGNGGEKLWYNDLHVFDTGEQANCPKPLFQSEAKCEATNKTANKTHFHMKEFAPSFFLKVRVFRTRNWSIENTQFTFS